MLNKFSIGTKLTITNVIYAVPVISLLVFYVGTINSNIEFSQKEIIGNEHQKFVQDVYFKVLSLTATGLNDENNKSILSSIQNLEASETKVLEDLKFTQNELASRKRESFHSKSVSEQFAQLSANKGELLTNPSYSKLISDLRGMITHLGDTSNLILDPDLDSYYLMDITLLALPQMQNRLQEIGAYVLPKLKSGASFNQEERTHVAVLSAMLKQSDLDRIKADIDTVLNEDANFYGVSESLQKNIPEDFKALNSKTEELLTVLNQISNNKEVPQYEQFSKLIADSLVHSENFWVAASAEMDTLLGTRVETQKSQKTRALVFSFIALAVAASISTGVGLNIRSSLISNLSVVVNEMKRVSQSLSNFGSELAKTSDSLASGTEAQASAVQETAATLDEITAMVNKSVDNAKQSAEEAVKSQNVAQKGKTSVEEVLNAIQEIRSSNEVLMKAVESANTKTSEVAGLVGAIANKTKVINDIVFQTKLLSFNASVEAARAGENGKGFAVVAEEVGNLAQMSGKAAQEIGEMVEGTISKVKGIVEETKLQMEKLAAEGQVKLNVGVQAAGSSSKVIDSVVENITSVTYLMNEISEAASQQSVGVQQIAQAMNKIDEFTSQTLKESHETAKAAHTLKETIISMDQCIQSLEAQMGQTKRVHTSKLGHSNVVSLGSAELGSSQSSKQKAA